MLVAIRVDASVFIGTGHVMRCLTLAGELRDRGARVLFISRLLDGNLCDFISRSGFELRPLPAPPAEADCSSQLSQVAWLAREWAADAEATGAALPATPRADWLIVDHYALDARWEGALRASVGRIMAIDDLADRPHDCNLLLDQNLYEDMQQRYDGLLPGHCRRLLGPQYALLRAEFKEASKGLRRRDGSVGRLLIFFGGSDADNATAKALEALRLLDAPQLAADVVVGGSNPHREELRQRCAAMKNVAFHCDIKNMASLMAQADLAIGAGGGATWERCFLGLPAITLVAAQNQLATTLAVAKAGAAWNLGWQHEVDARALCQALRHALQHPQELVAMGGKALAITGGGAEAAQTGAAGALFEA